ncbi:MAG: DUF1828 domain-containing protein [Chloroflexi bacterium]|nr:DUF1828 domain-containing protein [Chloroflexota bacterium]MYD47889.1 DUF1828 domain-containing protein [Chloroflexota bacterium]
MSLSEIARDLQAQISKSMYVEAGDDGRHYVATPFVFGDGDQPVIALAPDGDGWMLSDLGSTLFRLGFQMSDKAMARPENKRRLNSALRMAGISRRDDELTRPLLDGDYADALFDFVHALLKIDELGDFGAPVTNPTGATPMPNYMHPRTPDVFDYLKQCVAQRRTITYGEVGQNVGLAAQGTAKPLFYIRDKCLERKLPPITAIVFNKSTRLPGKGLKPDGTQVTSAEWKDMLGQVFATDWSNVDLVNDRK